MKIVGENDSTRRTKGEPRVSGRALRSLAMTRRANARAFVAALLFLGTDARAADNVAAELEAPAVNVVGTTPLPGIGTAIEQVPANVQVIGERELRGQAVPGVAEYLEAGRASFTMNQSQGNPYQPDVNFRGFSASPLLGAPQGLSVYVDGVRVNEAFGDVVNWDLIPRNAISSISVIPGSNPVFGLNTLGGALALYTKTGLRLSRHECPSIRRIIWSTGRRGRERRLARRQGLFRRGECVPRRRLAEILGEPHQSVFRQGRSRG